MQSEGAPKRKLQKEIMLEHGGAGVYSADFRAQYDLKVCACACACVRVRVYMRVRPCEQVRVRVRASVRVRP
jgi:hypothetical protein